MDDAVPRTHVSASEYIILESGRFRTGMTGSTMARSNVIDEIEVRARGEY